MVNQRGGMLAVTIAVLALGGLYVLFRQDAAHGGAVSLDAGDARRALESVAHTMPGPQPATVGPSVSSAPNVQAPAAAVPDSPRPAEGFRLVIADARPGVETPVFQAKQGEPISFAITSNRPGTLEVHGYNRRIAIQPGVEATFAFKAELAGRFPIDLHGRDGKHVEVTALEIMPR
jgi:hypothetical protein